MLQYKMTQYTDFVKAHMTKRKMSWNCAVCDIKSKKLYKPRVASPKRSGPAKNSRDSQEFIREFDREFNKDFLGWLNKLTPGELTEMARDAPRGKGMPRNPKKVYKPKVASPKRSGSAETSSDPEEFIREFDSEVNKDFLEWLNKLTSEELSEMVRDAPRGRGMRYATRKSKKSHRRNTRGRVLKSKK